MAALSLSGALSGLGASGCTGVVAQAQFRLRPDTTHWGNLEGPFEGHIFDQGTTNPIPGAMVIGSWAFESESGPAVPIGAYSINVLTGSDGSYSLPILPISQSRSALLRRFTLVVYKAGYVGYRSDVRWDDRTPRFDFAQLANVIRLERLTPGDSRAQHLMFLGGGQPLLRAAQAEVIQAALDLAEQSPRLPGDAPAEKSEAVEKSPAKPAAPPSLAELLLGAADLETVGQPSGQKHEYIGEPLPSSLTGTQPGEYSGVHYRAKGEKETADAALRVFRTASGVDAEAIWKQLRAQLQSPQLRDNQSGPALAIAVPAERAATPLLLEVPEKSPPLRDGEGAPHALPPPHTPPEPAANATANAAAKKSKLTIDASITVFDAKQRAYGVVLYIRRLGLVMELICGADLCPNEEAAHGLLTRSLSRL
jgi:hypothetical protein